MQRVDEARWIEQYRVLEKPLFNVVYRWVWDAAEAQDIVQDAFLRCWKIRDRIRADTFKALIYRTALRLASNQRRRRKLWHFVQFESESRADRTDNSARTAEAAFVSRPLRGAVDGLPERLKRVLLLSEVAGMSYKEIAAVMDIKEGTVGSRRSRALALLRERLAARGVTFDED